MPTTALTPKTTPAQAPAAPRAELDLEARLAARDAQMTLALETAHAAIDVNTAHIPVEPVDLADVITIPVAVPQTPLAGQPQPAEPLYDTPAAALLQRALQRLQTDGWCTGLQRDEDGATCFWGAIHAEARDGAGQRDALDVLLEVIRRHLPGASSIPEGNDQLTNPAQAHRYLSEAAYLAHARRL